MDTAAHAHTWNPPLPEAPGFEHSLVEVPGARLHVATIGEGRGGEEAETGESTHDPIVLLHGFPQHWWEWREVAPTLAAAGHRVIVPDLRGHGWTEAVNPKMRRHIMRDDLTALLDTLGLERVHLVGHDVGAVVASQFAYAYPERVRTLIQLSVPPFFMEFTPKLLPAFAHMPRLLVHRDGRSIGWLFSPTYLARPLTADEAEAYLRVEDRPGFHRGIRTLYRGMIIPEVMYLAAGSYKKLRLHPPTLAVFGRRDGPFTEDTVRRISRHHERHADHFEHAMVDGAAHYILDDAPDAVAHLIAEWTTRWG